AAARACTLLGTAAWIRADRPGALHWLNRAAVEFAGLPDSAAKADALLELARAHMMDYETQAAVVAAQQAEVIATHLNLIEVQANARITIGLSQYIDGEDSGLEELQRISEFCRVNQLSSWRRAGLNLGWAMMEEGDAAGGNQLLHEVRATAAGGNHALSTSANERAQNAYLAGDWAGAIDATAAAMRRPTDEWDLHTIAIAAWMRVLRGEAVEVDGEDPIETVVAAARRSGFHRVLRSTVAHASFCRALQGRADDARELLDELDTDWSSTSMIGFGEWLAGAGHAAALLGGDAAVRALSMFERSTRRTPWVVAAEETTSGSLAADPLTAAEHYLAAADIYAGIGTPSDEILALSAALRVLPPADERFADIERQVRDFAERTRAYLLLGPQAATGSRAAG
ncbi:MAG: guanylate cyclase, partial [Catenulispora sp.]|nr:guanylate cyclase [Catenulispora sp.]